MAVDDGDNNEDCVSDMTVTPYTISSFGSEACRLISLFLPVLLVTIPLYFGFFQSCFR
jgi:hypothetical protein